MGGMHFPAVALFTGCLAILLGVVPLGGLLDLLDQFRDEMDRFRLPLTGARLKPVRPMFSANSGRRLDGQFWFAMGGAALIVLALFSYLFR